MTGFTGAELIAAFSSLGAGMAMIAMAGVGIGIREYSTSAGSTGYASEADAHRCSTYRNSRYIRAGNRDHASVCESTSLNFRKLLLV